MKYYKSNGLYLPDAPLPNFTGKLVRIPSTKELVKFGNCVGGSNGIRKTEEKPYGEGITFQFGTKHVFTRRL